MMERYVITIARSYGSGGRTMGRLLANELGMHCYDREILRMASDDSGINEGLFGDADERLKGSPLFRIARKAYTGEVFPPESDHFVSNDNLFNYQAKIIRELADTESCIIIGRCADFILKDYKNVIRLYFYAPLEDCIGRVRELFPGDSDKEITRKISKIDRHRAEYYKYYTGRDWNDARNYDMCLNTGSMDYGRCLEMVKEYLRIIAP